MLRCDWQGHTGDEDSYLREEVGVLVIRGIGGSKQGALQFTFVERFLARAGASHDLRVYMERFGRRDVEGHLPAR